jgi:hypothetical protein
MNKTSKNPTLEIELYDQDTEKCHSVEIAFDEQGIYIIPKGYGDYYSKDGHGIPIMVEMYGGKPRVILWDDINEQDSTHTISLEGAREDKRKPDEDGQCHNMSRIELDKLRDKKLDEVWENYDFGFDAMGWEFADSDGWEHYGGDDEYWRTFYYYEKPESDDPSTKATFTVRFNPGSVEVLDAEPSW